jgi:hypothetical protein
MPQAPTANMLLIKPTELGDSGVWASLLDSMFDLIDAHDHSTGKGVKVSMANGVSVAADIPWNSAGTFYAITGLKAIDFQPQPQSAMTAFAGALFIDSANNELSYRTTGGAIVRFTNGATFNFSAIGAIGGDYVSAGALVDFVDANDLYRFRQQLGGGVQQYARLDCGGVDLFEFKANPTVGVPLNRVRHSSPAALAASYDVTWPAATPALSGLMRMSSAGVVDFQLTGNTVVSAASAQLTSTGLGGPAQFDGAVWNLSTSGAAQGPVYGIPYCDKNTLTSVTVLLNKTSAAGTITATCIARNNVGAIVFSCNGTLPGNNPGWTSVGLNTVTVGAFPLSLSGVFSLVVVIQGGGTTGDSSSRVIVTYV